MSSGQAINDPLAPLRAKYLAQLGTRRTAIASFLAACQQGQPAEELCNDTGRQAHSLAGSGATYGFPDISQAARALEHALQDGERNAAALAGLARALLAACDKASASAAPVSPEPVAIPPAASGKKPLLLVVDDDPAVRELLAGLFAQDAEIIAAVNGCEALEMIERHKPDLVILDDAMPEMSGLKVLETLHANPGLSSIPVVMLTASDREKDVMRGLMAGAVDYIAKPFDPAQLAEKIRTRLKRRRYTILIVDDDATIRDLLAHKFLQAGCRVLTAEDGNEALEKARADKPDLVILDRMMPGLDGIAVLQKMRQEEATRIIPVLFLTAKRQEQDVLEGFKLGAADYIVKPFRPEEVLARSLRLLKGEKP